MLAILVFLGAQSQRRGNGQDGYDEYYRDAGQWVDIETGYRLVKAMSVVSQPEILYCSALGQGPDLRGVVFRLEYEDGGVEETEFVHSRKVRYSSWECSGSWINYGMILRTSYEPTLGPRKEAVFFNNAQVGGGGSNSGGDYADTLIFEDNTELLRVYVDAVNLTVEEYLREYPAYVLTPGRPARNHMIDGRVHAAAFTPGKDGAYLFRFTGGREEYIGCRLMILDGRGEWAAYARPNDYYYYEYEAPRWSDKAHSFALRLKAGEAITIFYCFEGYTYYSDDYMDTGWIGETPLELSVLPLPPQTHTLRPGGRIDFTGGCLVLPEIPAGGRYIYRVYGAYPVPLGSMEEGLGGWCWDRAPEPIPWVTTFYGAFGTLYPYTIYDTDYYQLVPEHSYRELGAHNAQAFALVALEGSAAVELAKARVWSARDITLRLGECVPLSDALTLDRNLPCAITEITGDAISIAEQDGLAMLRADKPGQASLHFRIASTYKTITITVTE